MYRTDDSAATAGGFVGTGNISKGSSVITGLPVGHGIRVGHYVKCDGFTDVGGMRVEAAGSTSITLNRSSDVSFNGALVYSLANLYTEGKPGEELATHLRAGPLNAIQEEIANLIENDSQPLTDFDLKQFKKAALKGPLSSADFEHSHRYFKLFQDMRMHYYGYKGDNGYGPEFLHLFQIQSNNWQEPPQTIGCDVVFAGSLVNLYWGDRFRLGSFIFNNSFSTMEAGLRSNGYGVPAGIILQNSNGQFTKIVIPFGSNGDWALETETIAVPGTWNDGDLISVDFFIELGLAFTPEAPVKIKDIYLKLIA